MKKLSNIPPRGTVDWFPEEMKIRKYIFDTWKNVCLSFGYQEYLTPIVENAQIYRAKSGEDVGGSELMTIKREDKELAIRPEMTPSVTRMITRIYPQEPKPIRYFSIANFMRFQKPQRGRNREFWQLNYDIFGADSINADIEIIQIGLEIMLAFGPKKGSFTLYINNRKLIDYILLEKAMIDDEKKACIVRIMDKWEKLPKKEIENRLKDEDLNQSAIEELVKFMESTDQKTLIENFPDIANNEGYQEISKILEVLDGLGYRDWIRFQPNIIRGFDYYDGTVFEVFDNHPENNRALFGGGRYNGLASIFGKESFPAVGCAPGDEATRIFLESWDLLKNIKQKEVSKIFIALINERFVNKVQKLAKILRTKSDAIVETDLDTRPLGKALSYANKRGFCYIIIIGEEEIKDDKIRLKNMKSGEEKLLDQDKLLDLFVK